MKQALEMWLVFFSNKKYQMSKEIKETRNLMESKL